MGWNPLQAAKRHRLRARWDLTALLNAADPKAPLPERHLWFIRLLEWVRHEAPPQTGGSDTAAAATSTSTVRLRHLLNVLDKQPEYRERVIALLAAFWREVDVAALLADFGFAPRLAFFNEIGERLRMRLLPHTPATTDLAELFGLLFADAADAEWLRALDDETLDRLGALFSEATAHEDADPIGRRKPLYDAVMFLAAQVRAVGFSGPIRQRISPASLVDKPFHQLARAAEQMREHAELGDHAAVLRDAQYLRALLDACRKAAGTVREHLQEHGVSVDLVFQLEQLFERTHRIEELLICVVAPEPGREICRLLAGLVEAAEHRRSLRAPFARTYSMLARKVAERSAETGEHYITRDRSEYLAMLAKAAGGGFVIAFTTLFKFAILALGLKVGLAGLLAGLNYASSFVLIHLLHWTVATKQPAMTAPAMAARLEDVSSDEKLDGFVDEVANLIRSQVAGIVGNVAVVIPVVLLLQGLSWFTFGAPLVNEHDAHHSLETLSLLGATPLYAAFTGVLLFASSLIAGWAENWFVLHKLDSAIRWNPRFVSLLGASRAERWSFWWRDNISGLASNISLGLMLGLVPAVAAFFALPIEVRHVTLSSGQIAAALGTLGPQLLREPEFWWCVAAIPLTGALNLTVSFLLAFKLAVRSRGIRVSDRRRIYAAIRARLAHKPWSFLLPPTREGARQAAG